MTQLNASEEPDGEETVYVFPTFNRAVKGQFKAGKLKSGFYAKVTGVVLENMVPVPVVERINGFPKMSYDPSTGMRIR